MEMITDIKACGETGVEKEECMREVKKEEDKKVAYPAAWRGIFFFVSGREKQILFPVTEHHAHIKRSALSFQLNQNSNEGI
jgi:hypothetical protein